MQKQSGMLNDPRKAPRLTPESVSKLSQREKEDRQLSARATRIQQLEVPITEALLAAHREGVSLEGGPKTMVPVHEIVVHVIGADDTIVLPKEVRESLIEKGGAGSSVFMLRSRGALAAELARFRLPPDAEIELPGRNRAEKRAARDQIERYPFREISQTLAKAPPEGIYYCLVHSAAGASIWPFRFDAAEIEAGLAEEYEKQKEGHAEASAVPAQIMSQVDDEKILSVKP